MSDLPPPPPKGVSSVLPPMLAGMIGPEGSAGLDALGQMIGGWAASVLEELVRIRINLERLSVAMEDRHESPPGILDDPDLAPVKLMPRDVLMGDDRDDS